MINLKTIAFWGILIFFAISGFVLSGEITLRMLGHSGAPHSYIENIVHVEDDVINWRYIAKSKVKQANVVMTYNSEGFRDYDHTIHIPSSNRIVVIGDSVTEGVGVEWGSVFANRVQKELGEQYEVVNVAMSGLNAPQVVHLFEAHGLKFRPRIVVFNFILNDCDFYSEFYATQRFIKEKDSTIALLGLRVGARIKGILKSSALMYFLKNRLEDVLGRVYGKSDSDYYAALWEKEENRLKIRAAFDKMQHMKNKNGFEVLVIIWPLLVDFSDYPYRSIHDWIKAETLSHNFSVADLLPTFSGYFYRNLQVTAEDSVHPNALGHKLAAQVFIEWQRSHLGDGREIVVQP
jgi:lysophospholipase L1-like esterase